MLKHDVALKGEALRKQAGFTLIELLIVIAIIAILAAIAIPQFLKYKQAAYLDSVRSDVKNAVTAVEAFNSQYGSLPTAETTCDGTTAAAQEDLVAGNNTSKGALNCSKGNKIIVSAPAACADTTANAGAMGYNVKGSNSQITSGPGSSDTPISYDSCTGQYSGF